MCGIFGYISTKPLNDEAILESLRRRGPDGQGKITFSIVGRVAESRCTLLHTRLSIIDLSESANQPMVDASRNYAIVFNGEIYNYQDLRAELEGKGYHFLTESDTEVLLYGYIHWKEQILDRLRGMFAFCIFDKAEQKLFIAKDHFGIKPLYYYKDGDTFCFSSTVGAIMTSSVQSHFTLCRHAIHSYLGTGSFISPETVLQEVKSLLPGHYLMYRSGDIRINQYYNLSQQVSEGPNDRKVIKEKLRDLMFDSVKKHMIADVPIGIFLSGGIDSSLIAGIASRISKGKINTFTVCFKGSAIWQDETGISTKTAQFLGSNHENILLEQRDFDETIEEFLRAIDVPSVDGLNTFLVSKAINSRVKVVLSGLGGDEIFAGYPVFHEVQALQKVTRTDKILSKLPTKILNRIGKGYLKYINYSLFEILLDKRLVGELEDEEIHELRKYFVQNTSPLRTVSIFEISNYMANMLLRDTDAVTMYHSLECRVPFVDKDIFTFLMSLDDSHKVRKGLNKPLLVETFPDLIVEETYRSPKRYFILPLETWVRNYLFGKDHDALKKIAVCYNIYPNKCPFSKRMPILTYRNYMDCYKWLILLKWVEMNQDHLRGSVC